jgi:O-succinylbenzoate synthase
MIISSLKYFKYSLPFVEPLKTASGSVDSRRGVIVEIADGEGNAAYGEIAPLEILNMTPVSDCIDQILYLQKHADELNEPDSLWRKKNFAAEVKFGIEQALESLKLIKNKNAKSSYHNSRISVNALLGLAGIDEQIEKTSKLIEDGYSTIKIKIDNVSIEDQIRKIKILGEHFAGKVKVRLDANKSLSYDNALSLLSNLDPTFVEYIEDPVENIDEMIELQEKGGINIAPDELATNRNINFLLNIPSIKYFIVKPVKFGFNTTKELIKAAELKNKLIVISSLFESAVGRAGLVYLASLIKGSQDHGLDTQKYLAYDISENIYPVCYSEIKFDINNYPPNFVLKDKLR